MLFLCLHACSEHYKLNLFVKVRIHFITVTERSRGEMHTSPLLSCDVCVHQSQLLADARGILSATLVKVWQKKTCCVLKQKNNLVK